MTSCVDLFVLRRVAVLGEGKQPRDLPTVAAIAVDCRAAQRVEDRISALIAGHLVKQSRFKGRYVVTDLGLAALAAEPTHMRDKPMFTNR